MQMYMNKHLLLRSMLQEYKYTGNLILENEGALAQPTIAYCTYGQLNDKKDNVIWVCHALTANADAADWWPGMIGAGCVLNTDQYFVVCANIIGSCYGSTGPLSIAPKVGKPYYHHFPQITVRDMVGAHILLRQHLGIDSIYLLAGGSMGGYQALEWARMETDVIQHLFLIATSSAESAWGIAIHTAQRLAIEADASWKTETETAGAKGLKAARAIGMLTYRSYESFVQHQTDEDHGKVDDYRASSYIHHQGNKLVARFNAYSYWYLGKAMDSHNLARGNSASVGEALSNLRQPALVMGIDSDMLCPFAEQQFIAANMPNAQLVKIKSVFGHDGFLIEVKKITKYLSSFLKGHPQG
jgi:homoserine O-acetyltransferase